LKYEQFLVQFSSCDSRWVQRVSRLGRHTACRRLWEGSAGRENEHSASITETYIETGTGHEASVLESVMMMMMRRRRRGKGYFSSPKSCTPSPAPTEPHIQWALGFLCMEIKRPGRESDKSVPSGADFKSSKPPPSTCHVQGKLYFFTIHKENPTRCNSVSKFYFIFI